MIGVPGGAVFVKVNAHEYVFTTFVDNSKLTSAQLEMIGKPVKHTLIEHSSLPGAAQVVDVWHPYIKS